MNNFDHGIFFIKTWGKYSRSGKLLKNAIFEHWEEFCLLGAVIEKTQNLLSKSCVWSSRSLKKN